MDIISCILIEPLFLLIIIMIMMIITNPMKIIVTHPYKIEPASLGDIKYYYCTRQLTSYSSSGLVRGTDRTPTLSLLLLLFSFFSFIFTPKRLSLRRQVKPSGQAFSGHHSFRDKRRQSDLAIGRLYGTDPDNHTYMPPFSDKMTAPLVTP